MSRPRPPNVSHEADHAWVVYGQGRYVRQRKDLGRAAGTKALGIRLERVEPGASDVPLHWHTSEEEGFLAMDGKAELVQTDAAGCNERRAPLRRMDAVVFPADRRVGHRIDVPTDADGPFTYLVFGERAPLDFAGYPGRNAWLVRKGEHGSLAARDDGLGMFAAQPVDYYEGLPDADAPAAAGGSAAEATLPERFGERAERAPPSYARVVAVEDVAPRTFGKGGYTRECRQLAPRLGAERFDINLDVVPPGHADAPLHFHLGDEECFYILDGAARLRMRGPSDGDAVETRVTAGDCIAFPAATGIAHQFVVPDDADESLHMLVVATRAPVDVVRMVESNKWILKRADLEKEALRTWGSAVLRDVRADWLDDEPLTQM